MLVTIEHYLSQAGLRLHDDDGQGLTEYVLMGALISIAAIAAMILVGPAIIARFTEITAILDSQTAMTTEQGDRAAPVQARTRPAASATSSSISRACS